MKHLCTLLLLAFAGSASAQTYALSSTFGNNGSVSVLPGPGANNLNNHLLQPDGKLLLTGYGYDFGGNSNHVSMVRIDAACGALDTTFGTGGMLYHIHEQRTSCFSSALQADGKIVGCGEIAPSNAGSQQWPGVYRYNADGSVDSTFNGTGYHRLAYCPAAAVGTFNKVWANADGTIICAGASGGNQIGVHRFLADGTLDPTYGVDGIGVVQMPNFMLNYQGTGLMLADGSVISICIGNDGAIYNIEMAKFDAFGEPDSTFGVNGMVVSGIAAGVNGAMGAAVQADGKILVSCYIGNDSFLMVRFNADGSTDTSYGTNGSSLVMQAFAEGEAMELLADGTTLQFGRQNGEGTVLKRDMDGQVVTTFGNNGFQDVVVLGNNEVFLHGFQAADGRITGYGGVSGGNSFVARITTTPDADALPTISFTGTELITTGSGSFQWYLDGSPINGATTSAHTPVANGTYTVSLSLSSDCEYTSAPYEMLNVGIGEATLSTIRLLQNPVEVSITVLNSGATQPFTLRDMRGRIVRNGQLVGGTNTIDVVSCASGIYLLDVEAEGGSQCFRVVKQ